MATPTMTWTRLSRRLGADHNPLRRRSDLIEAWLLPGVIAAFLALGPLAAAAAGMWVHSDVLAARQAERSWHSVPAVLLQAAPGPVRPAAGSGTWAVWTPAHWTAGGLPRAGQIPAPAGTRAGSAVPVWLDGTGKVGMPPLTAGQIRDRVAAAASAALAGLAVLLAGAVLASRWVLDRSRLAAWETAWQSEGPQWACRPHQP